MEARQPTPEPDRPSGEQPRRVSGELRLTGEPPLPGLRGRAETSWLMTVSLMVLASVAVAAALWYTRPVMVPFVLAIFISYLVSPLVDFLRVQWRLPKAAAVTLSLLVAAALLALLAMLIITSTRGLLENIDLYRARIINLAERGIGWIDRFGDFGQDALVEGLRQVPLLAWLQRGAGEAVGFVTNGVLVLIFVVYLLSGRHPNQFRSGIYAEIDTKVRHYIVIKFATSATTGLLTGIILSILGLDLALVFGVMAFLLNFIPSIGSVIATLLPLPVALIQYQSGVAITLVVLLPGAVQFTIGNIVEPLIMGEGLDLHPIIIILALVFWGLLWGVVGMLLAAPITAILRIVFARFEITRPLAEVMAGRFPDGTIVPSEA